MKEKREYTEMTITVLKDTEEHLKKMAELLNAPIGHMVDKLTLNWAAKDSTIAACLIIEDLLTHTIDLDWDETNQAFAIVIAAIRKCVKENDPDALKTLVVEVDSILNPSDKKYLS